MRHIATALPADSAAFPLPANQPFAYATLHRAELTGDPVMLGKVLQSLGRLDMPVILPLHPRTMKVIAEASLEAALPPAIHVSGPLGYLESVDCIRRAAVVVTDSGGVQREAYWLGTPCVTVRGETEWEETVSSGANVLAAPEKAGDLAGVVHRQAARSRDWNRDLLGAGDAAERIAAAVASTEELAWRGSR
jgi:UDP-GlcNAc3NAcA epimerase